MSGLTSDLILFADSYIADPKHDRVSAAMSAWPTLSYVEAMHQANHALRRGDVRAYIATIMGEVCERVEITPEKIYREIAKIAFSSLKDHKDVYGEVIPLHLLPDHVAAALSELDESSVGGVRKTKLKLYGKMEALKVLLQTYGLTNEGQKQPDADLAAVLKALADKLPV